ncbi:MAG: tetratricopeptide repeat protein [Flavobacteriales bacterium]|nr:tetratricopeptide repeat protein [Flavobacteriales bacterium]MBP6696376.1 tetratricopeptide repeat protein [Flavobacteriales bacterium]
MIKTFAMFRPFVFVLAMAAQCMASAQQYKNEPRYDTLNTRHDKSRSLVERFFLTANHGWACFNRGLKEEGRATCKEQLDLAEQIGVDSLLSIAYDDLSSAFSGSADAALQLKYAFRALEYAKASGSPEHIGTAQKGLATVYKPLGDLPRALDLLKRAITNVRSQMQTNRTCCHLSDCYRLMGQPDSALYWAQRSNIISDPADDDYGYARSYYMLGAAYAARGDRELAEVHFKRCIEVADSFHVMIPLYGALLARGRMNLEAGDLAGAIADGRRGSEVSQEGDDLNGLIESAELLRDAFKRGGQLDSAFHYFELKAVYDDSLKSATNLNRLQNMAFEQELKEQEDAKLKAEEVAARSRNIQFGIIALIVITLGIFLLIFSRTAVVGAKAIKNLSLIALLLFFEFINLLLHPFLDRITNHSPILMLLCMAAIAGLLIPLHHRMEKLITNMLVSKNNRVRLEAARRTIEELEGGKTAS